MFIIIIFIIVSDLLGFSMKTFCSPSRRCSFVVGPFQSDALLVPEHCVFDHVHDAKLCTSYSEWNRTAVQSCVERGLAMQSFAILQPCGVDRFNGVEFVCCPRDHGKPMCIEWTVAHRLLVAGTGRCQIELVFFFVFVYKLSHSVFRCISDVDIRSLRLCWRT